MRAALRLTWNDKVLTPDNTVTAVPIVLESDQWVEGWRVLRE